MPPVADFRLAQFAADRVDACGKHIGRHTYWKLYAIENLFRIVVNSVLTAQLGPGWWTTAVDPRIQGEAQRSRNRYSARPWHTQPGNHDLYFTNLSELVEIIRVNSHLIVRVIPDINDWIVKIEHIRLPRNIVGHMNFPTSTDQQRIDVLYSDCRALVVHLQLRNVVLEIP